MIDQKRLDEGLEWYRPLNPEEDCSTQCFFTDNEQIELIRLARLGLAARNGMEKRGRCPVCDTPLLMEVAGYTDPDEIMRLIVLGEWAEKLGVKALKNADSIIKYEWPKEHYLHDACTDALAALPKESSNV